MALASGLAGKFAEAAAGSARGAWDTLVRLVRDKCMHDKAASAALAAAAARPTDEVAVRKLGQALERVATEAIAHFQQGLVHCRDIGDRYDEAGTLRDLGTALQATGQNDEARRRWNEALTILTDLRHPSAAAVEADLTTLAPTH